MEHTNVNSCGHIPSPHYAHQACLQRPKTILFYPPEKTATDNKEKKKKSCVRCQVLHITCHQLLRQLRLDQVYHHTDRSSYGAAGGVGKSNQKKSKQPKVAKSSQQYFSTFLLSSFLLFYLSCGQQNPKVDKISHKQPKTAKISKKYKKNLQKVAKVAKRNEKQPKVANYSQKVAKSSQKQPKEPKVAQSTFTLFCSSTFLLFYFPTVYCQLCSVCCLLSVYCLWSTVYCLVQPYV